MLIIRVILIGLTVAALSGAGGAAAKEAMTPFERAVITPRGELKSPYPDVALVAKEGHKIYLSHDCNGCHGGGGGGGMAAPLTNVVWIYGNDDDTLFRVIDAFAKQGFVRKGSENVVGPMPPFGQIIETDDKIWKIIAWLRTVHCSQRLEGC